MIEEGSPEWFAARTGAATCSLLASIMSNGRKAGEPGAPYFATLDAKAWEIVSGSITPSQDTFAMRRGVELEPVALERYEAETGRLVEKPGFLLHREIRRFGGTPDAITITRPLRCLQVKCPYSVEKITRLRIDRDVSEYFDQVQGEMLITGSEVCDVVIYDDRLPSPYDLTIIEVPADREYQARILERVQRFLADLDARVLAFRKAA